MTESQTSSVSHEPTTTVIVAVQTSEESQTYHEPATIFNTTAPLMRQLVLYKPMGPVLRRESSGSMGLDSSVSLGATSGAQLATSRPLPPTQARDSRDVRGRSEKVGSLCLSTFV